MMADVSKLTFSADMSDSLLPSFERSLVLVFSTDISLSMHSILSHENWSIDGHFDPRRMYFLRLSVDCKNESFCLHIALGEKAYLHALLKETALFGILFVIVLLEFGVDVALIAVIVETGLNLARYEDDGEL
jgi:hypothetical protein